MGGNIIFLFIFNLAINLAAFLGGFFVSCQNYYFETRNKSASGGLCRIKFNFAIRNKSLLADRLGASSE